MSRGDRGAEGGDPLGDRISERTGRRGGRRDPALAPDAEHAALTVRLFAAVVGPLQDQLAEVTGLTPAQISLYRHGHTVPRAKTRAQMAQGAGLPLAWVEAVAADAILLRGRGPGPAGAEPAEVVIEALGRDLMGRLAPRLAALRAAPAAAPPAPPALERAPAERAEAAELWREIEPLTAAERKAILPAIPAFHRWAFVELLCARSDQAAPHAPEDALALARLAAQLARRVEASLGFRDRLIGYSLLHEGNALRVMSDLPRSRGSITRGARLFAAGRDADPGLLDEAIGLVLEASLARAQRQEARALELLERAAEVAYTPASRNRALVLQATVYQQFGRLERAVEILSKILPSLDESSEPRCAFGGRFNLAGNLLDLGRLAEAEELLPDVRARAERIGYAHDLLRLHWLEARFEITRGRREEGMAGLDQVRSAFVAEKMPYDAALAALELAALHLEAGGRAGLRQARTLAEDVVPIFKAQGVAREGLAAVKVFVEAAKKEIATAAQAREALAALRQG